MKGALFPQLLVSLAWDISEWQLHMVSDLKFKGIYLFILSHKIYETSASSRTCIPTDKSTNTLIYSVTALPVCLWPHGNSRLPSWLGRRYPTIPNPTPIKHTHKNTTQCPRHCTYTLVFLFSQNRLQRIPQFRHPIHLRLDLFGFRQLPLQRTIHRNCILGCVFRLFQPN